MRMLALVLLTVGQFTLFPFLAIVAGNTARHAAADASALQQVYDPNMTVVYKSASM